MTYLYLPPKHQDNILIESVSRLHLQATLISNRYSLIHWLSATSPHKN